MHYKDNSKWFLVWAVSIHWSNAGTENRNDAYSWIRRERRFDI
jgi:hypothetical protein